MVSYIDHLRHAPFQILTSSRSCSVRLGPTQQQPSSVQATQCRPTTHTIMRKQLPIPTWYRFKTKSSDPRHTHSHLSRRFKPCTDYSARSHSNRSDVCCSTQAFWHWCKWCGKRRVLCDFDRTLLTSCPGIRCHWRGRCLFCCIRIQYGWRAE